MEPAAAWWHGSQYLHEIRSVTPQVLNTCSGPRYVIRPEGLGRLLKEF